MEPTAEVGYTRAGGALTELLLEVFRLNGRLLASGDRLVADLGLTSARWQVLGAIALAGTPLPVAHIARNMGLTRQAVQRIVNELAADGLVGFAVNPHHRRAKLVLLTKEGRDAYQAALDRQIPWANRLAAVVAEGDLDTALRVARRLVRQLETTAAGPPDTGPADGERREFP
jgi:DNA-binding MarR family transcriptional regulator